MVWGGSGGYGESDQVLTNGRGIITGNKFGHALLNLSPFLGKRAPHFGERRPLA